MRHALIFIALLLVGCGSGGNYSAYCVSEMTAASRPERVTNFTADDGAGQHTFWYYRQGHAVTYRWDAAGACATNEEWFEPSKVMIDYAPVFANYSEADHE